MSDSKLQKKNNNYKDIFLLSDSRLFFQNNSNQLIDSLRKSLCTDENSIIRAAYIGVSNGSNPDYFEIFIAAMNNVDIHESRMISEDFNTKDKETLRLADLILLAGGDFATGMEIIKSSGIYEALLEKHQTGAVIVGVSAGAVQLGMGSFMNNSDKFVDTLKLVPYYISVNDDDNHWNQLKKTLNIKDSSYNALGISKGGGIIFKSDYSIEPIDCSANEFCKSSTGSGEITHNLIFPQK